MGPNFLSVSHEQTGSYPNSKTLNSYRKWKEKVQLFKNLALLPIDACFKKENLKFIFLILCTY